VTVPEEEESPGGYLLTPTPELTGDADQVDVNFG
jgi:hypothetical protein